MILDAQIAKKTAELLLQINAIKLNPETPFVWASGWKSPIYCDNRLILSFPKIRNFVAEQIAKQIDQKFGKPDLIAGVATGAIGIGVLAAQYLGLPFVYVRPQAKKHGRKNQVEGFLQAQQKVVVIEDLISTGKSSLNAVNVLKDNGAVVKGMMAIFTYGFETAKTNFLKAAVELYTLADYPTLLDQAVAANYISEPELEAIKTWQAQPDQWDITKSPL